MKDLFSPVIVLGGIGLVFGVCLAIAAKVFYVKVDERVLEVKEALPGANCGACGFPGCDALAVEIVEGRATVNACPIGSQDCTNQIAKIMGVESTESIKKVAIVFCGGTDTNSKKKFKYVGLKDCISASNVLGGDKSCSYGCIGLASCVKVCAFDAITISDGLAVIDSKKCTGCEMCVSECPKKTIKMIPYNASVEVMCNSNDKGKNVKESCDVGCISCQICVKACPENTIGFENNLAFIIHDNCTGCGICVEKCPTKAIEKLL